MWTCYFNIWHSVKDKVNLKWSESSPGSEGRAGEKSGWQRQDLVTLGRQIPEHTSWALLEPRSLDVRGVKFGKKSGDQHNIGHGFAWSEFAVRCVGIRGRYRWFTEFLQSWKLLWPRLSTNNSMSAVIRLWFWRLLFWALSCVLLHSSDE